uniref:Endonuclease V n=1 Tax=Sinocyclocheilus anshuiensis TaxID=1608454 RepID=A0A671QA95_9TELE
LVILSFPLGCSGFFPLRFDKLTIFELSRISPFKEIFLFPLKVLFVDGNGLFHYREFGLACHLGVLSDLPCVGVAKNLLHVEGVVRSEEHQIHLSCVSKILFGFSLMKRIMQEIFRE